MYTIIKFDDILKKFFKNYSKEYDTPVTIGILVADGLQDDAKQYILNYMNIFDMHSGKYFDFYIPGYYEESDENEQLMSKKYHPNSAQGWRSMNEYSFTLSRTGKRYYFSKHEFDCFIEEMRVRMGIEYTYNPMLILIEVNRNKCRGQLEFQDRIIIELDATTKGVKQSGRLFDKIFDIAKNYVGLDRFSNAVRMYYIKGKAVKNIVNFLCEDRIKPVVSVVGDIWAYRIRSVD